MANPPPAWRRLVRLPPGRSALPAGAVLALTALLVATLSCGQDGAAAQSVPVPGAPSLAGRLLVAAPGMRDPRFAETVIYLVRHDRSGAMGLVVNKPLGDIPLTALLERFGGAPGTARGSIRAFWGGPVDAGRAFMLHIPDVKAEGTLVVDGRFALSGDPKILAAIASGSGPRRSLLAIGYAGWGSGQLEGEMEDEGWITAAADESLLFDDDHAGKWRRALARRLLHL
jgi:putative transcriptional regulator